MAVHTPLFRVKALLTQALQDPLLETAAHSSGMQVLFWKR
jgi:hypothetical protein